MDFISLQPFLYTAIAYFDLKKFDSCITVCQLLAKNRLQTKTIYDKALDRLNTCLAMSLDDANDNYFTVKRNILELMHQPSRALKQYDTAYYIFHKPLQLYNKARVYDAQFENYQVALRYYQRYLENQHKTEAEEKKEVLAFGEKRVKQLEEWEKNAEDCFRM